jgi:hypothetical protein
MTTSQKVDITGAWTLVYDAAVSGAFTGAVFCLSADQVIYRVDQSTPGVSDAGFPGALMTPIAILGPDKLYARAVDGGATLALDRSTALGGFPAQVFEGMRAINVQFYDESNKKLGAEWEASRLITIASSAPANKAYSILLTGSKPIDLKARSFAYTGLGVIGRIYEAPTYTGGTEDPWFNLNTQYIGVQPEAKLLVGFTLTANGIKCGADIIAVGPTSSLSRGARSAEYGSNRILPKPNTAYLLEIASLNQTSQQVAARLEIYEGPLDLPL